MTAQVTILCGPPRSGKTERLLARYRRVLGENVPGTALWLAPTHRAAAELRGRLLGGPLDGCFSPGVTTFARFAQTVVEVSPETIRPVGRLMKRQLVRRLIGELAAQRRLRHFRPIASTSGLVDLVCDFISELKRLEIWPKEFHDACSARGISDKDVELWTIYDAYQRHLEEHHLYDAEGVFWSARDWLGRTSEKGSSEGDSPIFVGRKSGQSPGARKSGQSPTVVVADGFTDFTRTQHEILEILAAHAEELLISLPLESEPRRSQLFAKPLGTLRELRRRHRRVAIEELARPEGVEWPAMAHLERTLFGNPRRAQPAPDTTGVEILAAARQIGEIELIGARIKRLLAEGEARPGDVAVVFRSPQDAGSLVAEVFGAMGIPVALEGGQALDRSPALRALAAMLQLDASDWPCSDLLAVLGSNFFQPERLEVEALSAAAKMVRQAQIPSGRKRLLEELEGRSAREAALALAVLRGLAAALDDLPRRATLSQWGNAWQRLAGQTGLLRAMEAVAAVGSTGRKRGTGSVATIAPALGETACGDGACPLSRDAGREKGDRHRGGDVSPTAKTTCATEPVPLFPPKGTVPFSSNENRDSPQDENRDSPQAAWKRLQAALEEGDRLDRWLGREPPELDRHEALAALLDIMASERLHGGLDESGRVRVLSAASVRALRIPHLFLAGLAEKSFPQPEREDRFYSESEYVRLIDEGLPLVARAERNCEEMLLFYEAMTRATRRLYFSYPALDEAAQPLSPSPYLREVEQACGSTPIRRTELTDLDPVPSGEPLSAADFRLQAVATALKGNVSLLAGLIRQEAVAENLLAGLELIELRQQRTGFGPAEGVLFSEAAMAMLAARFPLERTFGATELEQYATCPFQFFLERVLKVAPVEELALRIDFLARGRLLHEFLATFHQRVNQTLGRPGSPLTLEPADYESLVEETLRDVLPAEPANPVEAALREVDRRLLVRWIGEYRGQLERYDALWRDYDAPLAPEFFEVSFGRGGERPPSTVEPLELSAGGLAVRISGRIDRIDTGRVAGHSVFNVLDYKTGGAVRPTPDAVAAGTALQLPLYALAACELLLGDRDAIPWQAGYWHVREGGFKRTQALRMYRQGDGGLEPEPEWEQIRDTLAETVATLVRGMRRGEFPVFSRDDRCTSYCPFCTVCRINQIRSLEKTWH